MDNNIDFKFMILSISKLKLGSKLEFILIENGISNLTDISEANEESLKKIPGIGYASARKILRSYKNFMDSLSLNDKSLEQQIENKKLIDTTNDKLKEPIHPVINKSDLCSKDKEIINFIIRGHSQQTISTMTNLSKRTLRHRLAMLKIDYQANTIAQLVCNILNEVYTN